MISNNKSSLSQSPTKSNNQSQQNYLQNIKNKPSQQLNQQHNFQYLFDPQQLINYFKSIKITSVSQKKSDFYTYQRFINITQQIYNEQTQISPTSVNIDSLLVKQKITQQQEKANQLKAKKIQIMQQLALLDDQVSKNKRHKSQSKDKINLSVDASRIASKDNEQQNQQNNQKNKKLIFSKQEHKNLVLKIVKERQQRQKIRLLMKQKQQQKLKKLQQQQKQLQLKKIEQEKRRKAQEIQEKLKKKKQMHQKFLEQQKQSQRKVQQIKNKKFLYQQISQKFQINVKMPLLQQQKKILKQKRQFAKAYSIDQIKSHEKAYLQLRENSMKKSQAKQIVKPNIQPIKMASKSSRLQKILEQQKLQQRKKLMQKKRAIQQKLQRQENYVEYLKENFSKIKIDKTKQQEIKNRIQKMKVKRQQIDSKAIGMNYLMEAKKKRRRTAQPNHDTQKQETKGQNQGNITVLSQQTKKPSPTQSRITDEHRKNNLMKKRQQKIQILIHDSSLNESQRIKKLKMQTEKINEAFKMKEQMLKYGYSEKVEQQAVELLLTSIQAKMGIIDISKEREGIVS